MKSNNLKRIAAIGLAAATLMPSVAFAKEFKDVTKSNKYSWAYDYIDTLSDKGVIEGYEDGTFKPERPVSLEETLKLLFEIINPSDAEVKEAVEKYGKIATDNGVKEWAKECTSYALSKGIISESVLKNANENGFFDYKDQKFPVRADIAVFFAKGLGLSNSGDESLLKHNDKDKINATTRGYLASLVKEGIFSATGSDGNFEGDRYIRRSEMAKITKMSYDYVEKNGVNAKTEKMTGKVLMVTKLNGADVLIIESGNNKYSFSINTMTKYKLGDKDAKYEDVKNGQEIEVEYTKLSGDDKLGTAKVVTIKNANLDSVGYVNSLDSSKDEITIRYRSSDKDLNFKTTAKISTSDTKTFKVAKDAKLEAFGNSINLGTIKSEDLVEFKTNDKNEISELKLFPKNAVVKGEVTYLNDIDRANGTLRLKLKDKKIYEFYTTNDTRDLGNIRVGDEVTLSTSYKVALGLGNLNESQTLTGKIVDYDKGGSYNSGYLILEKSSGGRAEYKLSRDVEVMINENLSDSQPKDLVGKYALIELDRDGYVDRIYKIDKDSIVNAMVQVVRYDYNNNPFFEDKEISNKALVIQSDNKEIKPTGYVYLGSKNPYKQYTVLQINGVLNDRDELKIIEERELGNPGKELDTDSKSTFKDLRDFRPYDRYANNGYRDSDRDVNAYY
ncbi:S-layer homology domain-containing protein [Peptoniphilus sp.]|uniref:S-layer homology domain-containing protein n=1 Tax=Peptoniphilus sp. TaxID=1971214 RepID=UPI003D94273D